MTSETSEARATDPFGDVLIGAFERAAADAARGIEPTVTTLLKKGSRRGMPLQPLGTCWLPSGHQVAMALRIQDSITLHDVDIVACQRSMAYYASRYPEARDGAPAPFSFMTADADAPRATVVATLRTDLIAPGSSWIFNLMYMLQDKARVKWPRQVRLDDPKVVVTDPEARVSRLPPAEVVGSSTTPSGRRRVSEGTQLRCNMRVLYDPAARTFSFARDAEMRDPALAASMFDMEPLPPHVPAVYGTMQDILYVFLAYIVGERRGPAGEPIRQVVEPQHSRRLRRIPSTESQHRAMKKAEAKAKKWRESHGLDTNDSDYDPAE